MQTQHAPYLVRSSSVIKIQRVVDQPSIIRGLLRAVEAARQIIHSSLRTPKLSPLCWSTTAIRNARKKYGRSVAARYGTGHKVHARVLAVPWVLNHGRFGNFSAYRLPRELPRHPPRRERGRRVGEHDRGRSDRKSASRCGEASRHATEERTIATTVDHGRRGNCCMIDCSACRRPNALPGPGASAAKTGPDMVEEKSSGKVHSIARKMCKRLIVTPKNS